MHEPSWIPFREREGYISYTRGSYSSTTNIKLLLTLFVSHPFATGFIEIASGMSTQWLHPQSTTRPVHQVRCCYFRPVDLRHLYQVRAIVAIGLGDIQNPYPLLLIGSLSFFESSFWTKLAGLHSIRSDGIDDWRVTSKSSISQYSIHSVIDGSYASMRQLVTGLLLEPSLILIPASVCNTLFLTSHHFIY